MTGARLAAYHWIRAKLIPPPATVLDVGAGDAPLADFLTRRLYQVTALDRSIDRLEMAAGKHVRIMIDISQRDWPLMGQWDAAVAVWALQHLLDDEPTAWRELSRHVRPGGQLLVVQRHSLMEGRDMGRDDPLNEHSMLSFERLADTTGWKLVEYDLCAYGAASYIPCGPEQANTIRAHLRRR